MQITIINQQKRIPISKRAIKAAVLKTLKILRANLACEITIAYVDNRTIRELNSRFLGKCQATDVLCFDLSRKGQLIADIVISTQRAAENSRLFKTSPIWESKLYLVHGILHLFGWRDHRKKDRLRMHKKALQIIKRI